MTALAPALAPPPRFLRLHRTQGEVFRSPARFRVWVAGRRSGKTHLSASELIVHAARKRYSMNWYLAPTYRQAKLVCWPKLKELMPSEYLAFEPNETDLSMQLKNGATIMLKGADYPDSLRGVGLDFIVPDEFAFYSDFPTTWGLVLRPALADRSGSALFITTPSGFNHAYDLYLRGLDPEHPDWASFHHTTLECGWVSAHEIHEARATMSLRQFRQEFEAGFETLAHRVYDAFERNIHVTPDAEDVRPEPGQAAPEVLVGLDFNVNPMSAVLGVKRGDQLHIFAELELASSNTFEMATALRQRFPNRPVHVYPDPSGGARKTSAPVGATDLAILRQFKFQVIAPSVAPPIVDRINAVQAMFSDATGAARLRVHPRCVRLIRCLEGLTYRPETNIPDKTLGLDHLPDGLGYLVWSAFNRVSPSWSRVPVVTS